MDAERWKQVDEVLQAPMKRPAGDLDRFLGQVCAGAETLDRDRKPVKTWLYRELSGGAADGR